MISGGAAASWPIVPAAALAAILLFALARQPAAPADTLAADRVRQ